MMITPKTPQFVSFIAGAKSKVDDKNGFLVYKDGRRYIKIIEQRYGQKLAFAFIDKETGDVLKPASWGQPARGSRGNIFDANNGLKWVDKWGVAYLR